MSLVLWCVCVESLCYWYGLDLWCVCVESLGYGYGVDPYVFLSLCGTSWLWVWTISLVCCGVSVRNFLAMGMDYVIGVVVCLCGISLLLVWTRSLVCYGVSVWNLLAMGME